MDDDDCVTPVEHIPFRRQLTCRVALDLADPAALAEFLELAARIIRMRQRIVIAIE
jgi:hypothetical protein